MSELHTFELRQREGATGAMTGGNSQLLMDGVPLAGVKSVQIAVAAEGIATITVEMYGHFLVKSKMVESIIERPLPSRQMDIDDYDH